MLLENIIMTEETSFRHIDINSMNCSLRDIEFQDQHSMLIRNTKIHNHTMK